LKIVVDDSEEFGGNKYLRTYTVADSEKNLIFTEILSLLLSTELSRINFVLSLFIAKL